MAVGDWHGLLACGLAAPVAVVVVAGLLQGTSRPDLDPEGFRAVYRAVWAALVLVGAGVTWRWLVGRRGGG